MHPGLVAGFADPAAGQRFDALWQNITSQHTYWCCAAELSQWSSFHYALPKRLSGEASLAGVMRWGSRQALKAPEPHSCSCALQHPAGKGLNLFFARPCACTCRMPDPNCTRGPRPPAPPTPHPPHPPPHPPAGGYVPWEPPTLELPKWCADIAANERQREYVMYANHPCQFLTNATAAGIAASYAVA